MKMWLISYLCVVRTKIMSHENVVDNNRVDMEGKIMSRVTDEYQLLKCG